MFKKKNPANRVNTDGTMEWRKKTSLNNRQRDFRESMLKMRTSIQTNDAKDLLSACEIPADCDIRNQDDVNGWLAENLVEFFNEISLHYAMATDSNAEWNEQCNNPALLANKGFPAGVVYLWREGSTASGKASQLPADQYIDRVLQWIEHKIEDESIFPPEEDTPFPPDFRKYVSKIFQRMFRAYVVIYANDCLKGKLDSMALKMSMTLFLFFGWHWELLDIQDQKEPKSITVLLDPIRERYLKEREASHRNRKAQATTNSE